LTFSSLIPFNSYVPGSRGLALITGGAHRLGRAIALRLGQAGYVVGIHYFQSAQQAKDTAAEIQRSGVPTAVFKADLRDPAQIRDLFAQVSALPYPLKVLVNSAAVMPSGSVLDISPTEWDNTFALNLRAPLLCAQLAARLMKEGGVIVNLTDTGAQKTWTNYPAYVVSKSALETLTRLLARSLAPRVRVNAIAPGLVLPSEDTDGEDWNKLVARVPLRRPARTDEIAETVAFLIQNEYITGQTIVVDGGYQMV
jgi:NAD(P)-dependent dehydrogenase (short-subunit alcohol dehydrogenase family)